MRLYLVLTTTAELLLLAQVCRMFGPRAPRKCPLCHSRLGHHARSCPWSRE